MIVLKYGNHIDFEIMHTSTSMDDRSKQNDGTRATAICTLPVTT